MREGGGGERAQLKGWIVPFVALRATIIITPNSMSANGGGFDKE